MELPGAGGGGQGGEVGGSDAAAGEDDEAVAGVGHELPDDVAAFPGVGGLAGGQQAGAAERDDLVDGFERVFRADVERPMEGDRQRLCCCDKPLHCVHVDIALRCQSSDHYTS